MKPTRRSFLKVLGAAPLAANAARTKVMELVGAQSIGAGAEVVNMGMTSPGPYSRPEPASPVGYNNEPYKVGRRLVAWIKQVGWPEWRKHEVRLIARQGRLIDPDLAALRSISPSAMLRLQWARNEARAYEGILGNIAREEERSEWHEKNRVGWF